MEKALANPRHPFSKFVIGSKETLGSDAEEAGFDVRKELLAFHEKFYSSNIMNLCVCGPHSIDVMEQWVIELFSPIKNLNILHPPEDYKGVGPKLQEQKAFIIHVDTIKDIRTLDIS